MGAHAAGLSSIAGEHIDVDRSKSKPVKNVVRLKNFWCSEYVSDVRGYGERKVVGTEVGKKKARRADTLARQKAKSTAETWHIED